jgi:hypothetical protein
MSQQLRAPNLGDHGQVDIASVNALGYAEIAHWLRRVVVERAAAAGAHLSELPHSFLRRVYQRLDPSVRDCFRDAVLDHLESMLRDASLEWWGDAGDELLLLVGDLFAGRREGRSPVPLLRYALDQGVLAERGEEDLQWRCLQVLVILGEPAEPAFWRQHYRPRDRRYAVTTLGGLLLHGAETAVEWVCENPDDPMVQDALLSHLPSLVQTSGADALRGPLSELLDALPEEARRELREEAERLGVALRGRAPAEPLAELDREELEDLARGLGLEPASMRRAEILAGISERLREQEASPTLPPTLPRELHTVTGVLGMMASFPSHFGTSTRDRVCDLFDRMRSEAHLDQDTEWKLESLYMLARTEGRNIRRDFRQLTAEPN